MTTPAMLHQHLRGSATRFPNRPAVRCRSEQRTYAELFQEASALARTLTDHGVGSGDRVAIWLPKGIEAIVALHGVLLAGAAYVPIDPAGPGARAEYILADCRVAVVITTAAHLDLLDAEGAARRGMRLVVATDEVAEAHGTTVVSWATATSANATSGAAAAPPVPDDVDRLAYVLYTSGSTGTPKGVRLSHRGGGAVVEWATRMLRVDERDRLSSHAPLHFDLSIIDVFCAAQAGALLVLVPDSQRVFGPALVRLLVAEHITVWYSVPGALIALLDASNTSLLDDADLRLVLYAGEAFPIRRLRDLMARLPRAEIHNLYGPTETNVVSAHRVSAADVAGAATEVPIGALCPFASGYLVDDHGTRTELVPGARGELVVTGDSVMLGYWGGAAAGVHHTGDIVHVDDHGEMVLEGRRDQMVKIRGYRVEPAEVENAMLEVTAVREACVVAVAGADGAVRLEGFVVGPEPGGDTEVVRRACSQRLPRYMWPERVSAVAALPRGSTGKVDRSALVAQALEAATAGEAANR